MKVIVFFSKFSSSSSTDEGFSMRWGFEMIMSCTFPPVVAIKLALASHSLSVWSPEYLNSSGCCNAKSVFSEFASKFETFLEPACTMNFHKNHPFSQRKVFVLSLLWNSLGCCDVSNVNSNIRCWIFCSFQFPEYFCWGEWIHCSNIQTIQAAILQCQHFPVSAGAHFVSR